MNLIYFILNHSFCITVHGARTSRRVEGGEVSPYICRGPDRTRRAERTTADQESNQTQAEQQTHAAGGGRTQPGGVSLYNYCSVL